MSFKKLVDNIKNKSDSNDCLNDCIKFIHSIYIYGLINAIKENPIYAFYYGIEKEMPDAIMRALAYSLTKNNMDKASHTYLQETIYHKCMDNYWNLAFTKDDFIHNGDIRYSNNDKNNGFIIYPTSSILDIEIPEKDLKELDSVIDFYEAKKYKFTSDIAYNMCIPYRFIFKNNKSYRIITDETLKKIDKNGINEIYQYNENIIDKNLLIASFYSGMFSYITFDEINKNHKNASFILK